MSMTTGPSGSGDWIVMPSALFRLPIRSPTVIASSAGRTSTPAGGTGSAASTVAPPGAAGGSCGSCRRLSLTGRVRLAPADDDDGAGATAGDPRGNRKESARRAASPGGVARLKTGPFVVELVPVNPVRLLPLGRSRTDPFPLLAAILLALLV